MIKENVGMDGMSCAVHGHGHDHVHCHKRVSWSAVFAGALVAIGLGFLLNLFGLAIGLSMFTVNETGASVIAAGGLIGIVIGVIVSMLVAGYAAGFLGRLYCPRRNMGIVYGFCTWTMALILSAFLIVHLGHFVVSMTAVRSPALVVDAAHKTKAKNMVATTQNADESGNAVASDNRNAVEVNGTPAGFAWSAFCIFLLFFIGAFSCCLGSCLGMKCCRED